MSSRRLKKNNKQETSRIFSYRTLGESNAFNNLKLVIPLSSQSTEQKSHSSIFFSMLSYTSPKSDQKSLQFNESKFILKKKQLTFTSHFHFYFTLKFFFLFCYCYLFFRIFYFEQKLFWLAHVHIISFRVAYAYVYSCGCIRQPRS
jgi:hypothetical protein